MDEDGVGLQLFRFAVGTSTSSLHGKSTTLPCAPSVRLLVLDERWIENSPIRVCILPFCTPLVFRGLPCKGEHYPSP